MAAEVEAAKKTAARVVVDEFVKDNMVLGIGSGSTVIYAVERLKERVKSENLNIICIPTSFQALQLITEGGLQLGDLSRNPTLDLAIDGADEIDPRLNLIKGGGGCQTQEKIVAFNSKLFIVIADYRKDSQQLGSTWKKGVPLEVLPISYVPVMKKLERDLGGKPTLRLAVNKAGPEMSDNGNFLVDVDFGPIPDAAALNVELLQIPGIVETGLFIGMAERAYFGQADGSVVLQTRDGNKSKVA
eukprot:TRINITY_DN27055_c0_g1_i1.p2 TRINITY_DN27055_c0_g1~~TRINITY_DN27055_c0_g1_i1.p2  ORF type:complete len:244 (+),score=32.12 TRINITY_DN27055_c0_g1_i1:43-774(+)